MHQIIYFFLVNNEGIIPPFINAYNLAFCFWIEYQSFLRYLCQLRIIIVQFWLSMCSLRVSAEDLHTNQYLEYSQSKQSLSEPLLLENHSQFYLVFKIKTNQKDAISLYRSHGFLPPHKKVELPVKLLQPPSKQVPLKLEINYAQAMEEEFNQGDSKKIASMKKDFFRKILNIYPEPPTSKDSFVNPSGEIEFKTQQVSKKEGTKHLDSFTVSEEQPDNPFAIHFATLLNGKVIQDPKQERKQEVKPQNIFKPTTSLIRSCKKIESQMEELVKLQRTPQSKDTFVSILQESDETKVQTLKKTEQNSSSTKNLFEQLFKEPKISSEELFKSAKSQNYEFRFNQAEKNNDPKTSFERIQSDNNTSRRIIIQNKHKQTQALQRQLENLQQKVHLYWEFNNDLQTIKVNQAKKYSILVFLIVSVMAFAFGGFIKNYQY